MKSLTKTLGKLWRPVRALADGAGDPIVLRRVGPDLDIAMVASNLDAIELVCLLGTRPVAPSVHRIEGGASQVDDVAAILRTRFSEVQLEGPRGGRKRFTGAFKVSAAQVTARRQVSTISIGAVHEAVLSSKADVLAWHSRSGRSRFVSIQALGPLGEAGTRHSHLLIRAKQADGTWVYVALETITGNVDLVLPFGAEPGWRLRLAFEAAHRVMDTPTLENAQQGGRSPVLRRRDKTNELQKELDGLGLGHVRLLEKRHTFNRVGLHLGPSGRHLSTIARQIYGDCDGPASYCLVVDDRVAATRMRSHGLAQLAATRQEQMLDALMAAGLLGGNIDEWAELPETPS